MITEYETKDVKKILVKAGQAIYEILLDEEDFFNVFDKKIAIIKQRGHASANLYLGDNYTKKKSLGKFILNTDRNVYLKDRLISKNKLVLDYRKNNLCINIKEMEGYSEIARENFFKNKDKVFKARHKGGTYQASVAEKIIKKKSGEKNYRAKLTDNDIKAIRERYVPGIVTQDSLAKEFGVSRSTISSIVTYKRWRNFHFRNIKCLDKRDVVSLNKKNKPRRYFSFLDFEDNKLVYLKDDKLIYYVERINEEGLVYLEVRNDRNDIIIRSDLLFSDELNNHTNREYSIAYKYPVKTSINDLVCYVEKLKEYI